MYVHCNHKIGYPLFWILTVRVCVRSRYKCTSVFASDGGVSSPAAKEITARRAGADTKVYVCVSVVSTYRAREPCVHCVIGDVKCVWLCV